MSVGAKVAKADQRLGAKVFDFHASGGRNMRNVNLVGRVFTKADHGGRLKIQLADAPASLYGDPAARAGIFQCAFGTRLNCQFFCTEQLLSVDSPVNDPPIRESIAASIAVDDRLQVVALFEVPTLLY